MDKDVVIIEADRPDRDYWLALWRFRDLFLQLTWKDLRLRYRQTLVGLNWVLVRPLVPMLILVLVFGTLAGFSSAGVPYPLFVLAALLPWQFVMTAMTTATTSLVSHAPLIRKVYFPRLVLPCSSLAACLVDLLVALVLFFGLLITFDLPLHSTIVFLPLFTMLALALAAGLAFWFSSLSVRHRDFLHAQPYLVQFGLYLSPVGFGTHVVPDEWRRFFALNPLTGIIDGFRWSLLGVEPSWHSIGVAAGLTALILASGLWWFRRQEPYFADHI
jgi:lipopolysaccharide transport system permease protein